MAAGKVSPWWRHLPDRPDVVTGLPRTQQLPPVSGPRVAPPPVPTSAPSARVGEPLPSLAELLKSSGESKSIHPGNDVDGGRWPAPMPCALRCWCRWSGPAANVGQAMLNAAQLALFEFADDRFELLPHDTRGTPDGRL